MEVIEHNDHTDCTTYMCLAAAIPIRLIPDMQRVAIDHARERSATWSGTTTPQDAMREFIRIIQVASRQLLKEGRAYPPRNP